MTFEKYKPRGLIFLEFHGSPWCQQIKTKKKIFCEQVFELQFGTFNVRKMYLK